MSIRKSMLFLLLLSGFKGATYAQGVAATATILPGKIDIGDEATVLLELSEKTDAARISWAPVADSFGKIEVLSVGKIDTLSKDNQKTYRQQIKVTGFEPGSFVIPPFRFAIQPMPGRGAAYTLITDSLHLQVQAVAVDTTKPFRPIKDVMQVPQTWRDYIWYIVGTIVVLLLAFLIYYYSKQKNKAGAIPPLPENSSDRALRQLRALEQQQIWQQGEEGVKEYYVKLTGIVRYYIEVRFGVKAPEQTTDEFLAKARNHPELKAWTQQLFTLLHTADMAKFARAQPHEQQHHQAMQAAQQLVQQSRPVIVDASDNKTN